MKKLKYLSLIAFFVSSLVFSQEFESGDNVISAHVGLGSSFGVGGSESPGLSVNYERGVWDVGEDVISLGGYLGIKTFNFNNTVLIDGKLTYTILGARGAYHINSLAVDNLDVYAGAMISFNSVSFSGIGDSFGSGGIGLTIFAGGRYYFSDNFAASLELGYGVAFANIGIAYKI